MLKLYDRFIDTLIYACPVFDNLSEDRILDYLEELESDTHTFLHNDNLIKLKAVGMLNDLQIARTTHLRAKITAIPDDQWHIGAFRSGEEWRQVSLLANEILNSLGILKREICRY